MYEVEQMDVNNCGYNRQMDLLNITQKYLINTIESINFTDNNDKYNWITTMEALIKQRICVPSDSVDSCGVTNRHKLCEAYYFYGVVVYAFRYQHIAIEALDYCAQLESNNWYLTVLNPMKSSNTCINTWLPLFLSCGLASIMEKLSEMWNECYCTPKPEDIFNCFDVISVNDVKAIVFGESPLRYDADCLYESNGFAFGVNPKNKEQTNYDNLLKKPTLKNICTALTPDLLTTEFKALENEYKDGLARKWLDIKNFSQSNKYLFYNIRLSYCYEKPEINVANVSKEMWDEFSAKIIDHLLTNNKQIKIYNIFYSPLNSPQSSHLVRDVLMKHRDNIEIIEFGEKDKCHVAHYDSKHVELMRNFFKENLLFYQLLSPAVLNSLQIFLNTVDFERSLIVIKFLSATKTLIFTETQLDYYRDKTIRGLLEMNHYKSKMDLFFNIIKECGHSLHDCCMNLMLHSSFPRFNNNNIKYEYSTREFDYFTPEVKQNFINSVCVRFVRHVSDGYFLKDPSNQYFILNKNINEKIERTYSDMRYNNANYFDLVFPVLFGSLEILVKTFYCNYSLHAKDDESDWYVIREPICDQITEIKLSKPIRCLKFVEKSRPAIIDGYILRFKPIQ